MSTNVFEPLVVLEQRIKTMLPEEYHASYESMQPVPMRSAGLKYDQDGNVAWDEIWSSFCDLALAGGPPHKGTLLEPGTTAAIEAEPEKYDAVVEEICRGVILASGLTAEPSAEPGWLSVGCFSETMASWLLRAIATENVAVRRRGRTLELPAAPHFRLDKEIKNVITVVAKTCHYWMGHMAPDQRQAIASLIAALAEESPLVQPVYPSDGRRAADHERTCAAAASAISDATGLRESHYRYAGWLGLECESTRLAIWMMRALVVNNVLSRREGVVLFVPIDPARDPDGALVAGRVARIFQLAATRGIR